MLEQKGADEDSLKVQADVKGGGGSNGFPPHITNTVAHVDPAYRISSDITQDHQFNLFREKISTIPVPI
jgi:hypothetical protein